jgi:hypothetical protein
MYHTSIFLGMHSLVESCTSLSNSPLKEKLNNIADGDLKPTHNTPKTSRITDARYVQYIVRTVARANNIYHARAHACTQKIIETPQKHHRSTTEAPQKHHRSTTEVPHNHNKNVVPQNQPKETPLIITDYHRSTTDSLQITTEAPQNQHRIVCCVYKLAHA